MASPSNYTVLKLSDMVVDRDQQPRIILASASPRRRDLLSLIVSRFEVIPSDFDESVLPLWPPENHVVQSALSKANNVAVRISDGIIIGADTIVVAGNEVLGKPTDAEDARRMLKLLSGRSHYVYTGVCVVQRAKNHTCQTFIDYVRTEVSFCELNDELIDAYIATGEPLDKAGAYGIQERGSLLVEGIIGDYFNVVGLPVFRLSRMLYKAGVPFFG